jgi:hypothetical protein
MPDPTDLGEKAISAAQGFIKRGQEVAKRETRVIRLQTQISRLRSQRQRLFSEMGQKVFDLFQRDLVKNQDLRMMCQQIRGIDAEIELRREEIDQLRRPDPNGERGIEIDSYREAEILEDEDEIIRD